MAIPRIHIEGEGSPHHNFWNHQLCNLHCGLIHLKYLLTPFLPPLSRHRIRQIISNSQRRQERLPDWKNRHFIFRPEFEEHHRLRRARPGNTHSNPYLLLSAWIHHALLQPRYLQWRPHNLDERCRDELPDVLRSQLPPPAEAAVGPLALLERICATKGQVCFAYPGAPGPAAARFAWAE